MLCYRAPARREKRGQTALFFSDPGGVVQVFIEKMVSVPNFR